MNAVASATTERTQVAHASSGQFPEPAARRLSQQTLLLSEFIERHMRDQPLPQLSAVRAVVHGHCHHKAVMQMDAEKRVLQRIGLDCEFLDSGCCGMAGAFGFEKNHYEVSIACGERVLLPAVRAAEAETLVVANGFSCREQIAQTTPRHALHLAEVLDLARDRRAGLRQPREPRATRDPSKTEALLVLSAGAAAIGAGVWWFTRRRRAARTVRNSLPRRLSPSR